MKWISCLCGVVLFNSALAVQADLVLFTDRAAFLSAAGGVTNIDFEENDSGQFTDHGASAVFAGVTFSDTEKLFTVDPDLNAIYDWGSGDILSLQSTAMATIQVALPGGGVTAAGSDIMSIFPAASNFQVIVNGTDVFTVSSLSQPNRAFAGFISDSPIVSMSFTALSAYTCLDNFAFSAPVPEPSSLALMIVVGGIGALALIRHKRRRA